MIQPIRDFILIEPVEAAETFDRAGLIAIPDKARLRPNEAIVLAVGEGRVSKRKKRIPIDVKVGDRVVFGHYAGVEVNEKWEKVRMLIKEEHILAILEEEGGEEEC